MHAQTKNINALTFGSRDADTGNIFIDLLASSSEVQSEHKK